MRARIIPQFEFGFSGETFNLAIEQTQDGARISAERGQSEKDRDESEREQARIWTTPNEPWRKASR